MKYLDPEFDFGAESAEEAMDSTAALEARLHALRERAAEVPDDADPLERAKLQLDEAELLVELGRGSEAWQIARAAFDTFAGARQWGPAVEACRILFLADQPESLAALGNGVWLAVTFPVEPELTLAMLQHIVDETPDDSDGAAVAAATASYVVDLRAGDEEHGDLSFFAMQLLGSVARRHGDVKNQAEFDAWAKGLELEEPEKFLVRLRNVVDVLAQDDWWVDREALQAQLPDQ